MSLKGSDPEVVRAYLGSSISIEGLHAAYGAVRVLEDVLLSVVSGETVVLLGTKATARARS
jgi:branched-chain amino acid transport system ATP-binding protein